MIAAAVIGGCAGAGCYFSWQKEQAAKEEAAKAEAKKKPESLVIEKEEKPEPLQPQSVYQSPINFDEQHQLNPDIYAWIQIPGTVIDYPILQKESGDQSYYLDTRADGVPGLPGSIYTENINAKDFKDANTMIYGHDMLDGSMFAQLHRYEDPAFFEANPYVYIYLPDRMLKYQIYAAVVVSDEHIMLKYDFRNPDSFQQYLNDTFASQDAPALFNHNVPVNNQSKIITMSTCIGPRPDNRWTVQAVLVEEVY